MNEKINVINALAIKNHRPHMMTLEDMYFLVTEATGVEMTKFEVLEDWTNANKYSLLYVHMAAEELLRPELHAKDTDWATYGMMDSYKFFLFLDIVMHPLHLIVTKENGNENYYLEEKRVGGRYREHEAVFNSIQEERILHFADDPPIVEADNLLYGQIKGMHSWFWITGDYDGVMAEIIKGNRDVYKLWTTMRWYDKSSLRKSLVLIANKRSGQCAAELLRLLQKEWPDIKRWKTNALGMTASDFEDFEDVLFHGFDCLLPEWESGVSTAHMDKPSALREAASACRYIDLDGLAATGIYTPEQFTKLLRQACEQDAKGLGKFLEKYLKLGYLDFHGEKKTQIYKHLKECFPNAIKYSYTNFTIYFKSI